MPEAASGPDGCRTSANSLDTMKEPNPWFTRVQTGAANHAPSSHRCRAAPRFIREPSAVAFTMDYPLSDWAARPKTVYQCRVGSPDFLLGPLHLRFIPGPPVLGGWSDPLLPRFLP